MSISPGYLAYRLSTTPAGSKGSGPDVKRGAEILDGPYPKSFADFIGQEKARLQIIAAVTSAAMRGAPMDHVLFASGAPGVGKTTLGRLTAHLRGVGFVELGGNVTDKDAVKALRVMEDGDVLFLDEIHRLVGGGKARAEWLLPLLQDGVIHLPSGAVQAPKITVIAATTDAQRLPQAMLDRFIKPVIEPYTDGEAVRIAQIAAKRLDFGGELLPMPADIGWLSNVTRAADNNPRMMGQLLSLVRDVALSTNCMNLDLAKGYDISTALEWLGLTPDGLTREAQNYMVALYLAGGTAGVSTLKAQMGEEQINLTERAIIRKGYVSVTPRGRELTDYGRGRAMELATDQLTAAQAQAEKEKVVA